MESLSTGTSPTLHVRVTSVRKAQVQKLADHRGMKPADIVRLALTDYFSALHSASDHGMICPQCFEPMQRNDNFVRCSQGHEYNWGERDVVRSVLKEVRE
jgi:hypothetical protein